MKMKKFLQNLIKRKQDELAKVIKRNEESTDADELRALGNQMLALRDEINDAEKQLAELEANEEKANEEEETNPDDGQEEDKERAAEPEGEKRSFNPVASFAQGGTVNVMQNNQKAVEERAKKFAETNRMTIEAPKDEMRAVLMSSGQLATPTKVGDISDMFNTVSSIVDQVKVTDMTGCGEYQVPYEKTASTANTTKEGEAANESDPTFGYASIKPTTITVLSYISKEVRKQTPVQYEQKVREAALKALKAKLGGLIAKGNPGASITEPTGVYNADADLIETLQIEKINETTLRKVALSYGGDENVVGQAVLYLNKKDLIAFGDVRGTNEKQAVYEITPDASNPNTGIIKEGGLSVRYCINSNIAALSDTGTAADAKTMFYGQPMNYECALFSNYEISVSEDFKFDKRQLAIMGEVQVGGNVIHEKGFVVVTKKAAV